MIPYGKQDIKQQDIDAVVGVLKSDFITQGPMVPQFEEAITEIVKAKYAVAVCNATAALHLACRAVGLSNGDWLWTTPITFVASANCALYCGAKVDFVDINPHSYNLCVDALKTKLAQARIKNKLPKALVAVHLTGQSCEMAAIKELSQEYGFKVIEDASHAIGGKYKDVPIGSCAYSDITVFSFHPVKIITTAEGGMAVTNNGRLAQKMALLRSHGITRDSNLMTHSPDGEWYYQQIELGYNYRMTELQAALGVKQVERLHEYVKTRNTLAERYDRLLQGLPLTLPWQHPDSYSARHLYVVRLHLDKVNKSHAEVFSGLREKGIGVNLHYIPIHHQPYYKSLGIEYDSLIESEKYYQESISLPLYPTLTETEQNVVIDALTEELSE